MTPLDTCRSALPGWQWSLCGNHIVGSLRGDAPDDCASGIRVGTDGETVRWVEPVGWLSEGERLDVDPDDDAADVMLDLVERMVAHHRSEAAVHTEAAEAWLRALGVEEVSDE